LQEFLFDFLPLIKAYRAWGHELGVMETPYEAGLAFTIDWNKPRGFVGQHDLLKQKSAWDAQKQAQKDGGEKQVGLKHRLVALRLPEEDLPVWGNEPILLNGEVVGAVTSANYAHSLGGQIALGYAERPGVGEVGFLKRAGSFAVGVGGTRLPAKATLRPPFDPKNKRPQGDYTE
jgi:4-methylaminobutanoate oxidase (formaldehyde-forming)